MDKYLLLRSELNIIADALDEYRERHCDRNCPHFRSCSSFNSCTKVASDFKTYGNAIGSIGFFDEEAALVEAMGYQEKTGDATSGLRWLPDWR
jgi:hypothetical protein